MSDLEKRLAGVERTNRRLGAAVLFLALGIVAVLTLAMADDKPDTFILKDPAGNERAVLSLANGGPGLMFFGAGGARRLYVGLDGGDNPVIQLFTTSGAPGYFINLTGAGRGASVAREAVEPTDATTVCITGDNGTIYHRCIGENEPPCPDMPPCFPRMMTLKEAEEKGLKPCPRCFPDE